MKDNETLLRETVNNLANCSDQLGLSEWEMDFVQDMADRKSLNGLSQKQTDKILALEKKYL